MTSNRWVDNAGNELPSERDVAYFVYLHLDTAERERPHPTKKGEWIYAVAGKPRPMLVLRRLRERAYGGCRRFLVLRLTSKSQDGKGNPREGVMRIGKCIHPDTESFLVLEPLLVPENLLDKKEDGARVLKPCDPLIFDNVLKIVTKRGLTATAEPRDPK
jgi:hypothetical protein